jgi:hypothetical protein
MHYLSDVPPKPWADIFETDINVDGLVRDWLCVL